MKTVFSQNIQLKFFFDSNFAMLDYKHLRNSCHVKQNLKKVGFWVTEIICTEHPASLKITFSKTMCDWKNFMDYSCAITEVY